MVAMISWCNNNDVSDARVGLFENDAGFVVS